MASFGGRWGGAGAPRGDGFGDAGGGAFGGWLREYGTNRGAGSRNRAREVDFFGRVFGFSAIVRVQIAILDSSGE